MESVAGEAGAPPAYEVDLLRGEDELRWWLYDV